MPTDPLLGGKASSAGGVTIDVRYLDRAAIRVIGPATRNQYAFSVAAPIQSVDVRDAPILLRTRYFRPA
jgi:hypothetical protein